MRKKIFILAAVLCLSACGTDWLGDDEDIDTSNLDKRIPVLKLDSTLEVDSAADGIRVTVPAQHENAEWRQQNDQNININQNLALKKDIAKHASIHAGAGAEEYSRLMAPPIIAEQKIFVLDGNAFVQAYDLADFKHFLWKAKTLSRERRQGIVGGGMAYGGGMLFVTNGLDDVQALDPKTGDVKWQRKLGSIIRSAPTYSAGKVYALSVDNKLYALGASDGSILWTHEGVAETLGMLGSPTPAVAEPVVVVPHSSGEIYALETHSGSELWSDSITFRNADTFGFSLPDIDAFPVISRGAVFTGSYNGLLVASDLKQGIRYWEHEMSLLRTPWVAGDFLYTVTDGAQLAAMHIPSGKIKWVKPLPAYKNETKKKGKISWTAPVMGGSYLRIANSDGKLLTISPEDGATVSEVAIPDDVYITPVIAANALYILSNDGTLVAVR